MIVRRAALHCMSCSQRDDETVFSLLSCSREDDRLACKRLFRAGKLGKRSERMFTHSPRAFPLGVTAPVGTLHSTQCHSRLPRARRPRPRICLRKGCGRKYLPRRWNQRYCQDPECLREVRRWQAARRQAKRRQDIGVNAQHARAQKERRQRAKVAPKAIENPEVAPARGHAAENFFRSPYAIGQAATNPP